MSFRISVLLALVLLTFSAPGRAQQADVQPAQPGAGSDAPPAAAPAVDADAMGVSLSRIQRRLSRPPAIRPDAARTVFRVEVFGRKPTIDEILGPDWNKGPAPYGGMTHAEFLNLVTPKDVQGYAAFDNKQGMIVAATSFALQWAVKQAYQKLRDAKTNRQMEEARKEVDDALAALRKARREAGLPDK
jgi:hypothetical protein